MKTIAAILLMVLLVIGLAFADDEEEKEEKPKLNCPKTLIHDQDKCMNCHVMVGKEFTIKETETDAALDYPTPQMKILNYGKPNAIGYYLLIGDVTTPETGAVANFFRYLEKHNISHAVMEVFSYGGGLFNGWRIKHLMDKWTAKGNIIETEVGGCAASAAAIIFVAGTDGYRTMNAQSELMFHELWTFKFIDISSPSDKEDEARVLRHLQDTITGWLATKGKKTKEELDALMRKKEFWINGKEALELGFADKIIGGN